MTDIPTKSSLVSPGSTEGVFQDALGAFYEVVNEMAENGAADEQTISAGAITPQRALVVVETEGSAPTDDLNTIDASVIGSKLLIIGLRESGRVLTIKHNTSGADHIRLKDGVDYVMLNQNTYLVLRRDSSSGHWEEIMRTSADLSIPTAVATGTGNALVVNFPAPLLMSDRRLLVVRASTVNLTTTPTINVDGGGAKSIVKKADVALSIGDITGANYPIMLEFDAVLDKFIMLNPAKRTELDLFLSDNSTLNASTSQHGFLRKLSNSAAQYLNGVGAWAAIPSAQVTDFLTSGTWTKPATGSIAIVELWSGGASGGVRNHGGGGAGGCYSRRVFLLSDLASTVSVTVGSGGASLAAGSNADGNDGGNTSFGSTFLIFGGEGGAAGRGGGGGGIDGLPAGGVGGAPKGGIAASGTTPGGDSTHGGGGGGVPGAGNLVGGSSVYGGGGGGGPCGASIRASKGGNSIYGGAGGGGSNLTFAYSDNSGGVSVYSGNGGKGGNYESGVGYDGADGQAPGGGGGGATTQYGNKSGKGGNGMARITVL